MACGACAKRAAERRAAQQAAGRTNRTIYAEPAVQSGPPALSGFSRPRYHVVRQDGQGEPEVYNTLAEAQKRQRDLGGEWVIRTVRP
jgi:hypothetical protein